MQIQIEKNVPMNGHAGRTSKYPWAAMQVGDSFLAHVKYISSLSSAKTQAENRHKMKFSCRTTPEGVRVWRIA